MKRFICNNIIRREGDGINLYEDYLFCTRCINFKMFMFDDNNNNNNKEVEE